MKILTALWFVWMAAQEPANPAFEVASIRPAATREIGSVYNYPGGRMELRGCTLAYLIEVAFDVHEYQISGGPAWMNSDRFDIYAKPPATSKSSASRPAYWKVPPNAEQRQMLQALLAQRFGLKYRRENRDGAVYFLVKGKKPLRMQDAKDKDAYPWSGGLRGGGLMGDGIAGINESMADLAWRLSPDLEHPVIDRTELPGSFDFRIEYKTDERRPDIIAMILTCVQELGLKLEPGRGPVETIFIDHAEQPSGN